MIYGVIWLAGLCVAYANGANDNFKGAATLFGSGTTDFRRALIWATATTFLGSIAAVLLAGNLVQSFSGKGLVEDTIATQPRFVASVALGTGLTVLLATRIGMPISTTHGLVGALIGTGVAAGTSLNLATLRTTFLLPLLISPVIAVAVTGVVYPVLRLSRRRWRTSRDVCLCLGNEMRDVVSAGDAALAVQRVDALTATLGTTATCQNRRHVSVWEISAADALGRCHFLSAGVVSFARGLNDTPKMAALLLVAPYSGAFASLAVVGAVMAIGGLLSARRVAETMSHRITSMNHGQGLTANVVTGLIVIGASQFGLPVSTTHVSCGALFGIGTVTGQARWKTIAAVLLAWLITLPGAAGLAAAVYCVLGTQ